MASIIDVNNTLYIIIVIQKAVTVDLKAAPKSIQKLTEHYSNLFSTIKGSIAKLC